MGKKKLERFFKLPIRIVSEFLNEKEDEYLPVSEQIKPVV